MHTYNVDLKAVPRGGAGGTSKQVMFFFRYHLYTGGWSFGRDPDSGTTIYLWAYHTPGGLNYPGYNNPTYDSEVNAMLTSAIIGVPTNPSDGKYHAYLAQDIFMGEAGIIPLFALGSFKGYLANWRNIVNQAGFGINSWWTFLNAYDSNNPAGYGDVIRYGWQGDIVTLNVVTAQWYWDWEVLGKIYDSLIAVNPYNVAQDLPYIASGWNLGLNGLGNTVINFTIREDVFWQDVPQHDRSAIAVGGGHQIDGPFQNVQFTPVDVAFSLEYIRDIVDAWNQILASPVDHVVLNPVWQSEWLWNATFKPPWYTADTLYNITWQGNYVEFSPSVDADAIMVVLNQPMAWIGLHWVGGVPLMPMHLWSQITQTESLVVDPIANDLLYGTGDWIFLSHTAGVGTTMIPFTAGQSYRGITLQNDYFWHPITRDPTGSGEYPEVANTGSPNPGQEWLVNGTSVVFKGTLRNYDNSGLTYATSVYFDYDIQYAPSMAGPWTDLATGTTNPMIVNVPGSHYNATTKLWTYGDINFGVDYVIPASALSPTTKYGYVLRIHDSMHWSKSAGPLYAFVGFATDRLLRAQDGYWSDWMSFAPGDVNHSGKVDISDAALLGSMFGKTVTGPLDPKAYIDINNSGKVDVSDGAILGANWSKTYTRVKTSY